MLKVTAKKRIAKKICDLYNHSVMATMHKKVKWQNKHSRDGWNGQIIATAAVGANPQWQEALIDDTETQISQCFHALTNGYRGGR